MAKISFTLTVGTVSITKTISPSNARVVEFLDDLIEHQYTDEVDDGNDGLRKRTQEEVADLYLSKMLEGVQGMARRVEQMRLDKVAARARDLSEG